MLSFWTVTAYQPRPRQGTHALVRYWANVFTKAIQFDQTDCGPWFICLTTPFSPAGLDFAHCHCQESAEHLCEKHLQKKRRGREKHFRFGKIGLIELKVLNWLPCVNWLWEQYRNQRRSNTTVTTKAVLKDIWQGNIFLENTQDISCIFVCFIKTNIMTTA